MPQVSASLSATIGGVVVAGSIVRSGETPLPVDVTLPAALAGTLTTRTDADTGILTVESGHGITTSHLVGVSFAAGNRKGCTVTGTTATTISIDVGTGTDLPATTTPILVAREHSVDLPDIDAADLQMIEMVMSKDGYANVDFGATNLVMPFTEDEPYHWAKNDPAATANPFVGEVVESISVCNLEASANRVRMGFLLDSVDSI